MPGLTSKEATRIEEGLHVEESLITKFGLYAQQCVDPECRRLMHEVQALHQRHYDTLFRQVNNAGIGATQMIGGGQMTATGGYPASVTGF